MSAHGQKATLQGDQHMSALPQKSDITGHRAQRPFLFAKISNGTNSSPCEQVFPEHGVRFPWNIEVAQCITARL